MSGLFNEYGCLNDRIEILDCKLTEEQIERHRLQALIRDLQNDVKDIVKVLSYELDEKYLKDPAGTLKDIYDKYKYTKFDDAPLHIRGFLRAQKLTTILRPENRTIGKILDGNFVDVNGRPVVINCVNCSKLKELNKKEEHLKAMEMDKYDELMESYAVDPDFTIKKIYDKYKYKKLDEVPYHIKGFITERYFIDLKDEKRVVGQILEDKHKDLLCGECKCDKKERKKEVMIDFKEVVRDGKEMVVCECDCGNVWIVPKEVLSGCVKCVECGTKSCSG